MSEPFLTDAEVENFTGLVQPAAQARFLRKHGIRCVVNAANKVRVTWDSVNAGPKERHRTRATLDLEALELEGLSNGKERKKKPTT